MKEVSLKKFKDLSVDSTVLVNVPKVDRGPLDGNNTVEIVLDTKNNLYQIGISVGIIKDWLPRNALQIATTTFTEIVPRINLSLREISKNYPYLKIKDLRSVPVNNQKHSVKQKDVHVKKRLEPSMLRGRYCDTLSKLKGTIWKKRPGLFKSGVLLLEDNASPYSSTATQNDIATVGLERLYRSPDLAPSDFHLFPALTKNLA
ncbi:histone-lysine N-methyltransferase SETMAR [Trichonephila clavipes]|nr:histone-lysine N-methyltransferase SETMAR [Trichonephila clavipes]